MTTTPYRRVDQGGNRRMPDPSSTHQLDFYQAMADFRHMFPNMDEEVIEAVLRYEGNSMIILFKFIASPQAYKQDKYIFVFEWFIT